MIFTISDGESNSDWRTKLMEIRTLFPKAGNYSGECTLIIFIAMIIRCCGNCSYH